jgi:aminoglycoside phosphotransferase family enzyme
MNFNNENTFYSLAAKLKSFHQKTAKRPIKEQNNMDLQSYKHSGETRTERRDAGRRRQP